MTALVRRFKSYVGVGRGDAMRLPYTTFARYSRYFEIDVLGSRLQPVKPLSGCFLHIAVSHFH